MKQTKGHSLSRRTILTGIAATALPSIAAAKSSTIQVWKTPTCGCCGAWV